MLHFVGSEDLRAGAQIRHILIAAESTELNDVELLLGHLPANSYGQVYIEAEDPSEYLALESPRRVTINWLYRSERPSDAHGAPVQEGGLVAEAVRIWIGEFLVDDGSDAIDGVAVWLGAHSQALNDSLSSAVVQRIH